MPLLTYNLYWSVSLIDTFMHGIVGNGESGATAESCIVNVTTRWSSVHITCYC